MSDIVPVETLEEIGDITKLFRVALLGEQLARIWKCSPSNISQAEKHGHGEIKKCIETILETQASMQCGGCSPAMGEEAIHRLISILNRVAGYHAFKPLIHNHHDIRGMLEAAKVVLSGSSKVLQEIDISIDINGEAGEAVSPQEAERLTRACDDVIANLAALKEFVRDNRVKQ